MPELPEIETVKLQLQKTLVGQKLLGVEVLAPKIVKSNLDVLVNNKVVGIGRSGKVLLVSFGDKLNLGFHFKMTGQLVWNGQQNFHTRVIFKFDKGTLYFNDQRLFAWVEINPKFVDKLGSEPFQIANEKFVQIFSKPKKAIKLAIMDQEKLSGVGNIYANDALWEAKINPKTPSNQLSDERLKLLLEKIKLVLKEGIKYGGATAADAKYLNLHGLGGHYQEHFRVYDREGLPCLKCKTKIIKFVLGGRGTYVCPVCQKS